MRKRICLLAAVLLMSWPVLPDKGSMVSIACKAAALAPSGSLASKALACSNSPCAWKMVSWWAYSMMVPEPIVVTFKSLRVNFESKMPVNCSALMGSSERMMMFVPPLLLVHGEPYI